MSLLILLPNSELWIIVYSPWLGIHQFYIIVELLTIFPPLFSKLSLIYIYIYLSIYLSLYLSIYLYIYQEELLTSTFGSHESVCKADPPAPDLGQVAGPVRMKLTRGQQFKNNLYKVSSTFREFFCDYL